MVRPGPGLGRRPVAVGESLDADVSGPGDRTVRRQDREKRHRGEGARKPGAPRAVGGAFVRAGPDPAPLAGHVDDQPAALRPLVEPGLEATDIRQ